MCDSGGATVSMNKTHLANALIAVAIIVCISSCTGTTLNEYPSKSQDETAIIAVLKQYQNAKNQLDITGYLAVLHPEGEFMLGGDQLVSKERLEADLPVFWERLRSSDPSFYPISRESMNGNYCASGTFIDPEITIADEKAEVIMTFSKGFWHIDQLVRLRREQGRWWIDRLDWVQN